MKESQLSNSKVNYLNPDEVIKMGGEEENIVFSLPLEFRE